MISGSLRIQRRAIHSIASRRIAAIGPVHHPVGQIEIEVNRLRQTVVKKFDAFPIFRILAFRDFDTGSENAALAGIVTAFLCPVDVAAVRVESDSDAPLGCIRPGPRIALARIDERFELGAIEIAAHDSHSLAIRPI